MEPNDNIPSAKTVASVAPVSFYEKHKKVYIRDVKGWWNNWRWILVLFTQVLFYGAAVAGVE
jgi:hypothetical protein